MKKKCMICGELKEHHAKGMCGTCYHRKYYKTPKIKQRTCKSCNKDISNRYPNSIYCYKCAKKSEQIQKEELKKAGINQNPKKKQLLIEGD